MKTITFLFTFLIATISFGQNLLVNGDFETGDLTGWGGYANGIAIENTVTYGTYTFPGGYGDTTPLAAPFTHAGWTKFASAELSQEITVVPGSKYIVQFFFRHSYDTFFMTRVRDRTGDVNGSFLDLTPIVPDTGDNDADATKYKCRADIANNPTLDWEEASFSFVAPAGVTKIKFQNWSNNTAATFIDEASIILDPTASVADLEKFNFSSYPNPVNDVLHLSAASKIDNIEIYNIIGQIVDRRELNSSNADINIANLNNGIYFVKAKIGDLEGTYRIIKE